jgi:MFS family permease
MSGNLQPSLLPGKTTIMRDPCKKQEAHAIRMPDPEDSQVTAIDPLLEAKLVRKQDLRVLPMVFLMYFFTFLDRTNLGNARIAGMEKDLGLDSYGFNIGACLFYAVYFCADIPASLSVKSFGFIVLPLSCIAFGIVTIGTAFIHNSAGFYTIRILLGLTESFQLPGLSYLISRYYRRNEITVRISSFMLGAAGFASGFGGLLASGLLRLDNIGVVKSWRIIFLVEGYVPDLIRTPFLTSPALTCA